MLSLNITKNEKIKQVTPDAKIVDKLKKLFPQLYDNVTMNSVENCTSF